MVDCLDEEEWMKPKIWSGCWQAASVAGPTTSLYYCTGQRKGSMAVKGLHYSVSTVIGDRNAICPMAGSRLSPIHRQYTLNTAHHQPTHLWQLANETAPSSWYTIHFIAHNRRHSHQLHHLTPEPYQALIHNHGWLIWFSIVLIESFSLFRHLFQHIPLIKRVSEFL